MKKLDVNQYGRAEINIREQKAFPNTSNHMPQIQTQESTESNQEGTYLWGRWWKGQTGGWQLQRASATALDSGIDLVRDVQPEEVFEWRLTLITS